MEIPMDGRKYPMRLNLFFMLIDLLTVVAYPFVYIWLKVRQLTNASVNTGK